MEGANCRLFNHHYNMKLILYLILCTCVYINKVRMLTQKDCEWAAKARLWERERSELVLMRTITTSTSASGGGMEMNLDMSSASSYMMPLNHTRGLRSDSRYGDSVSRSKQQQQQHDFATLNSFNYNHRAVEGERHSRGGESEKYGYGKENVI
jgi:hypothetical protein